MHSVNFFISSFLLGGCVFGLDAPINAQSANEILMAHNNAHIQAGGEAVVPLTQEQKNLIAQQTQLQWNAKKGTELDAQNQAAIQVTDQLAASNEQTGLAQAALDKKTTIKSPTSPDATEKSAKVDSELDLDDKDEDDVDSEKPKTGKGKEKEKSPVDPISGSSSKTTSGKSTEKDSTTDKSAGKSASSSSSSSSRSTSSSSPRSRTNGTLADSSDEDLDSHANSLSISSVTFFVAATFAAYQTL